MSLMERAVIRTVHELHRLNGGPVRTLIVADLLGKHDRTLRGVLVRLEQRGYVRRVGQRGGWLPVR